MERKIIEPAQLTAALETLDEWEVDGSVLKKQVKFNDFADALKFVNRVGELSEAADHHPDIRFGWGYAELFLTTHDRGGVTDVDIALAAKIDFL